MANCRFPRRGVEIAPPRMKKGSEFLGSKKNGSIRKDRYAPDKSLRRIEKAAAKDVEIARLAEGLLLSTIGNVRRSGFPGKPTGLFDWRNFPAYLKEDVRALVDWVLLSPKYDMSTVYRASTKLQTALCQERQRSPIGRRYRNRARYLRRLYPPLPRAKWGKSCNTFTILSEEVGNPLTERVVALAKAFAPTTIQIVNHQEPMNGVWTEGVLSVRLSPDGYTVSDIRIAIGMPSQAIPDSKKPVEGELVDYFETGTEGVIWMIEDDGRYGREALEAICEGDHLTIMDKLGATHWRGIIKCDKKVGLRSSRINPAYRQQCALGCWVHWIQKGMKPDKWAGFFMRGDNNRLHGILRKARDRKRDPRLGPAA